MPASGITRFDTQNSAGFYLERVQGQKIGRKGGYGRRQRCVCYNAGSDVDKFSCGLLLIFQQIVV